MKELRCRFCGARLDPDDREALAAVRRLSNGAYYGFMHLECAMKNLPPGKYEGWMLRGKPLIFEVKEHNGR